MFYMEDDSLFVRDEESVNGVFVRIHETVLLEAGDRFLVGEQLFEVQTGTGQGQNLDEDLTHFFGTELRPFHWRLQQILDGGQPGSCRCLKDGELTLGRDGCDLDFPADRFISGKHCALRMTEQGIELVDQGSRNGTYLRIKEPHRLVEADHLFIGKQLLRVELSGGAD
jgi:predicted component of type VI protein secretion system